MKPTGKLFNLMDEVSDKKKSHPIDSEPTSSSLGEEFTIIAKRAIVLAYIQAELTSLIPAATF